MRAKSSALNAHMQLNKEYSETPSAVNYNQAARRVSPKAKKGFPRGEEPE